MTTLTDLKSDQFKYIYVLWLFAIWWGQSWSSNGFILKLFDLIKSDDNRSLADIVLDTGLDCNLGIALKVEKGKISGLLLHPYVKVYKYGRHKSFLYFWII